MRVWILLGILLTGCATTVDVAQREPTEFELVCERAEALGEGYSCNGMEPPIVVVSHVVSDHSWNTLFTQIRGLHYRGEPYVFVRPGLEPDEHLRVLLHEIAHYVLENNGLDDRCLHEEYARMIAGQEPDEWRARYGCLKDDDDASQETST